MYLALLFVQLLFAATARTKPVWSIDVLPEDLEKTAYWHKEYNDRCGVAMIEAHGVNASLSFHFIGSGIIGRFLTCEACSNVEIQVDKLPPIILDLSDRGFQCPNSSPIFVKTDFEEEEHYITIKRLDETRMLKVMKFEYLTSKPGVRDALDRNGGVKNSDINATGSAVSQIAQTAIEDLVKKAVQQAVTVAASYVAMAGVKLVLSQVAGSGAGGQNTASGATEGAQSAADLGRSWSTEAVVDEGSFSKFTAREKEEATAEALGINAKKIAKLFLNPLYSYFDACTM